MCSVDSHKYGVRNIRRGRNFLKQIYYRVCSVSQIYWGGFLFLKFIIVPLPSVLPNATSTVSWEKRAQWEQKLNIAQEGGTGTLTSNWKGKQVIISGNNPQQTSYCQAAWMCLNNISLFYSSGFPLEIQNLHRSGSCLWSKWVPFLPALCKRK